MEQRLIDVNEAKAQIMEDKIPENHMSIMGATGCGPQAETLNQACDRHIKMLDELPTVEAIPVEWVENYITLLIIGGHSDHEPELEEENKKRAQAIRGMLEYYKLDKRISNLEEAINKIKSDLKGVNTFFNE